MAKDTEKIKTPILPVPLTKEVHGKLMDIQAERQKKTKSRTSLKKIVSDLIMNAKS